MSEYHWLSRVSPRSDIAWDRLIGLGALDPYGQHQALCKLFDLPPKTAFPKPATPFLFRAERIEAGHTVDVPNYQVAATLERYEFVRER